MDSTLCRVAESYLEPRRNFASSHMLHVIVFTLFSIVIMLFLARLSYFKIEWLVMFYILCFKGGETIIEYFDFRLFFKLIFDIHSISLSYADSTPFAINTKPDALSVATVQFLQENTE